MNRHLGYHETRVRCLLKADARGASFSANDWLLICGYTRRINRQEVDFHGNSILFNSTYSESVLYRPIPYSCYVTCLGGTMNETSIRSAGGTIITLTLLLAIGYAILRYHIVGDVPWKDFSLFILNKGLCLGAFILLTFNFALGPAKNLGLPVPQAWLSGRKAFGMSGFLLILIHVLISFMLFSPAYFRKFFALDGTLTGVAGVSMLAGILGFVFLWAYNLSFQTNLREDKAFIGFITSRRFLIWALLLGGMHLAFMGYSGWFDIQGWHGGLPPISLVAFGFFATGYILNLFGRE